jgi:hypothetical protein
MNKLIAIVLAALLLSMQTGCVLGDKAYDGPEVPKASTMTIPPFGETSTAKISAQSQTKSNFNLAGGVVFFWTVTTAIALLPPVVCFGIVHSTEPEETDEGWKWEVSNTDAQGVDHSAVLTVKEVGDKAHWTMSVTNKKFTNHVWFTGISSQDAKTGSWTFYDSLTTAVFLFEYQDTDAEDKVRAEVIDSNLPEFGNYIEWSAEEDRRTFLARNELKDETWDISWSYIDGSGYIYDVLRQNKVCWDTKANGQLNVLCTN